MNEALQRTRTSLVAEFWRWQKKNYHNKEYSNYARAT